MAIRSELSNLGQKLAEWHMALSARALDDGAKVWEIVPKFHLWWHLTEMRPAPMGIPRSFWPSDDEDLVWIAYEIAGSVRPSTLAISAVFKWRRVSFVDCEG
eukprot:1929284-Pyramimonas_sp.AAC.1